MEDNKFDPTLGNTEENNEVQEAETVETEAVEADEATAEETTEEVVAEAEEASEDAEEAEETAEEEVAEEIVATEEKPKKKKKKGKIIVISILAVIAVLIGALCLVAALSIPRADVDATVVSVGDVDSNTGEFINVYGAYTYYASYYGFSADDVKQYTIDELTAVNSYYSKAMAEGYVLSDEEKAEIEENIASLQTSAEGYGMTIEEYLEQNICKGYTLDDYRVYIEKQYIAQAYYAKELEAIDNEYKGEDAAAKVQEKYESDKTAYDLAKVSYWYLDATDENSKAQADEIVAKVKDGMEFEKAVVAVTGTADATPGTLTDCTKSVVSSKYSQDAADWVFAVEDGKYVNGAGAVEVFEIDSLVYVFYAYAEPAKDESVPVTVSYIQIDVSAADGIKSADELKLAAKSTATSILKEFESGEKTAEAFAALQESHGNGENALVSADVFAEITAGDAGEDAVDAWAFDAARKAGDYALIEGDGCFYIVFFESVNENAVWYQSALDSILDASYKEWDEQIKAEFADKTVLYDDAIEAAINYVNASAATA